MPKYAMTNFGTVHEISERGIWPNMEKPVVVIDREEWRRMVALWNSSWNDDNGADKAMEIDAIIAKVEEDNR